jgi:hypothetical protein
MNWGLELEGLRRKRKRKRKRKRFVNSGENPKFLAHPASPAPGWWQGTRRVRSKSAVKLL